jgi:hypothetical protein
MSSEALAFWAKYKTIIIGMARLHQGYVIDADGRFVNNPLEVNYA